MGARNLALPLARSALWEQWPRPPAALMQSRLGSGGNACANIATAEMHCEHDLSAFLGILISNESSIRVSRTFAVASSFCPVDTHSNC